MNGIYNKIIAKSTSKKILFIVLCVVCFIFLVSLIISIKNIIDFASKAHSSDGVIISVSENNDSTFGNYSYEVEFYDNYDNFCSSTINSNKVYDIDDYVKVYYNYSDDIYLERDNPLVVVIPFICLGVMVVLLFLLRDNYKADKTTKKIITDNNVVYARIDNVVSKDKDGKKYYNIVCSWVDSKDGKNYTFYSEDLDFDPTMSIRVSNKNSLNVYLDKSDYSKYIVDVKDIKNNKI